MLTDTFGLSHLWAQSDIVIKLVAFTLVVMSVASWYLIAVRTTRQLRARRFDSAVEGFWSAASLDEPSAARARGITAALAVVRSGGAAPGRDARARS